MTYAKLPQGKPDRRTVLTNLTRSFAQVEASKVIGSHRHPLKHRERHVLLAPAMLLAEAA